MGEVPLGLKPLRIVRSFGREAAPFGMYASQEMTFDWSADLAALAERCVAADGLAKACGFASAVSQPESKRVEAAVYVIAVDGLPVCKIGISTNPVARLAALQGAHWADLSIYSLAWCPTRKAETVEQTALEAAKEMGVRLNGEWVAMEAAEALSTVLKAGRYRKIPMCDSDTWMKNWNIRLEALRQRRLWERSIRPMVAA